MVLVSFILFGCENSHIELNQENPSVCSTYVSFHIRTYHHYVYAFCREITSVKQPGLKMCYQEITFLLAGVRPNANIHICIRILTQLVCIIIFSFVTLLLNWLFQCDVVNRISKQFSNSKTVYGSIYPCLLVLHAQPN